MCKRAILLQQVSFIANGQTIVDNVTGLFPKGKITVIVGPSGAGKTTLLKLCNNLLSAATGDIYIEGQLMSELPPTSLRREVGIVLQSSPMVRGDVFANLALPLQLQGKTLSERRALEQLKLVGLAPNLLHQDTKELSGGQRQKVSIARTLLNEPVILLLDEITSALDPVSLREIEQLIATLNRDNGITIVWITHDLEQAKRMGQHVWVMVGGKLVEAGDISILEHPTHPEASRFLKGDRP